MTTATEPIAKPVTPETPKVPPKPALKKEGPARRIAIWAIAIVILGGVGYWTYGKLRASPPAKMITAKVAKGDIVETVSASGSITAQTGAEVHIGAQISGRIKRLTTDVGSYIKAGQVVVELDLPDLRAQLDQANAALALAETKYAQQVSGVGQVRTQTASSLDVASQAVLSARQKLVVAEANAKLQAQQTPTDIKKASTALTTAQSVLAQTKAGADLQITTAKEAVIQAQANATNSAVALKRAQSLYDQGFTAAADLDLAKSQDGVFQSQVRSATHNVEIVQQKMTADLQASSDAVASAQAVLEAARMETQTVVARNADVRDAAASVRQAEANLDAAHGNTANDTLKSQDVTAALDAVKQATAQVAYNQAQMDKSFIRSPISGTVLQLAAQQGETVSAGLSTQTLLIVADLKRLEVDAFVDETDIGKVAIGQVAKCTVNAFPGQTFTGKVSKVASGSTIQQAVVTYDVTIAIEDPKHVLKPDMTAAVSIETGHLKDVLVIPSFAVQAAVVGSTVNVFKTVNGQDKAVSTPIVTGGTDGTNIEVKSGLKEGDVVILAGAVTTPTKSASSSPFGQQGGGGPRGGGGGRGG